MTAAVLITGAPGAGKTSVLEALGTLLEIEGVEHGAIETEELTRGFPGLPNTVLVEALACAVAIQQRAGRSLFLIVFTAEASEELGAVLDAAGAERSLVVCLRAPAAVLTARLERREPDRWPGRGALIEHARGLATAVPSLEGIDLVLDTDGREAEELAHEVKGAMRERRLI